MRRKLSVSTLAVFGGLLISIWVFLGAEVLKAQVDSFTFFIPYPADILDDQFDVATFDEDPGSVVADLIDDDIVTTISISVMRTGTIIYYDHWEDGLEPNLTFPRQSTTQVWGDGNPANGSLPAQNPPNTSGTDVLNSGDIVLLENKVIVPVVVPRPSDEYSFDGGDKLTAIGGNVAVSLAVWPESSGTLFAGAWELYPTSKWETDYIVPVGEDLAGLRGGFGTVGFNVQALNPNTAVSVDIDGNGSIEFTETISNSGGHYTKINGVTTGTKIQASDKVQVQLLTGDPKQVPNSYEARAYTLVPQNQWTGDYIAPRSSDGDYWLYNPGPTDPLIVTAQTSVGPPQLITIPAKSTQRFALTPLTTATGVRFTAASPFYGVVALDASFRQDWGYALLPVQNLTTQALLGWGVGNVNKPPDGDQSRLYVTAITDTMISVDFNNDKTVDLVVPVPALAEVSIVDPDHDLTGAFLFSSNDTRFAPAWGQDQSAPAIDPSIDVGTNIVPLPSLTIQKNMDLLTDTDGTGTISWGDTVRFIIRAYNNSDTPLLDTVIEDSLPASVTYVPGSTKFISGTPISDKTTGTPFPLDEGGHNIGTIAKLSSVAVSFDAIVNDNVSSIENTAIAKTPSITTTIPDPGGVDIPVLFARYELDKYLIHPASGIVGSDLAIQYGIAITSTGNLSITTLTLEDTFKEEDLTFVSASPHAPDASVPGKLTWNDLAQNDRFGPLPPGRRIDLILDFTSDVATSPPDSTINVATVTDASGTDGIPLPPQSDDVPVQFPTPTPTSPPPPPDEDDDGGIPPIIPPSTAIAPPTIDVPSVPAPRTSTPEITPLPGTTFTPTPLLPLLTPPAAGTTGPGTATVFPVALLPETGERPASTLSLGALIMLLILGLWILWIVSRRYNEAALD